MKYLGMILGVAIIAALAWVAAHPHSEEYLPEVDDFGYRCEGDCDPDVPCRYCNPRR